MHWKFICDSGEQRCLQLMLPACYGPKVNLSGEYRPPSHKTIQTKSDVNKLDTVEIQPNLALRVTEQTLYFVRLSFPSTLVAIKPSLSKDNELCT